MSAPRIPPHDLLAEEALLGAMLLSTEAILDVLGTVDASDFYKPAHGNIFTAVVAVEADGASADAVTVYAKLVALGLTDGVEPADLIRLAATCPRLDSARHYAAIVCELARKRRLAGAGAELTEAALDPTVTARDALSGAETLLLEVSEGGGVDPGPVMAREALEPVMGRLDAAAELGGLEIGLTTGYLDLDAIVGGLTPGSLVVVAGRSGMGKTAYLVGMALANAGRDTPTLFASLEMGRDEIVRRSLSQVARVPERLLKSGRLAPDQRSRVDAAARRIEALPFAVDERSRIGVGALRMTARAMQTRHGLGLVIIDYLQLLAPVGTRERREVEVRELAEALKALAKDLGVVVVAGSQLNREPDRRQDHRPLLSDLRESGGVEQAGDVVVGLYRSAYYDDNVDPGLAEAIVLKNRSGPTGVAKLGWLPTCASFVDLARNAAVGP